MATAPEAVVVERSPRRSYVTHAWLTGPVFTEFVSEATRRDKHPDVLTAKILEAVILGGLVDELLDR
jgi:hypothetical protein